MITRTEKTFFYSFPGSDAMVVFDAKVTLDHHHFGNDPDNQTDVDIGEVTIAGESINPDSLAVWRNGAWRTLTDELIDHAMERADD